MSKKLWMAATIAAVALALTACGGNGNNDMNDKAPVQGSMVDSGDMKTDDMKKDDMMNDDMKKDDMMNDDMKSAK